MVNPLLLPRKSSDMRVAKRGFKSYASAASRNKPISSGGVREDTPRPDGVSPQHDYATGVVKMPIEQVQWPYQCILDRRVINGRIEYLIKWVPTWQEGESLSNLDQAVGEYEDMQRLFDHGSIDQTHFHRHLSIDDTKMANKALAEAVDKHHPQILK